MLSRLYARTAGMPLLIGLLVVTFAIAADLAHEAWATALSEQQTAERALRDFVRFSATSTAYEVQASIELGLRTLFAAGAARGTTGTNAVGGAEALVQSAAKGMTTWCSLKTKIALGLWSRTLVSMTKCLTGPPAWSLSRGGGGRAGWAAPG